MRIENSVEEVIRSAFDHTHERMRARDVYEAMDGLRFTHVAPKITGFLVAVCVLLALGVPHTLDDVFDNTVWGLGTFLTLWLLFAYLLRGTRERGVDRLRGLLEEPSMKECAPRIIKALKEANGRLVKAVDRENPELRISAY